MRQVERHWIKEGHALYPICDDLTFKAKNLYNAGLYQIRQSIFERNKSQEEEKPSVLSWVELVSQFRKEKQSDMLALPSKVSTNILKILGSTIHSYYQTLKAFHDKSNLSVTSKPQLPRYLHKTEGRSVVEFTSQTISRKRGLNGELILCPKDLNLSIPTKVKAPKSVRIVPRLKSFVIEVVYEVEVSPLKQTGNYAAIDLGIDNLATITFSDAKGIEVVEQEESYTSKASFLDEDEIPVYENVQDKPRFSGRRVSRGLYKSKDGSVLNADVNGSYNILVKGLLSLGKTLNREVCSFHTRSLKTWQSISNKDLLSHYM